MLNKRKIFVHLDELNRVIKELSLLRSKITSVDELRDVANFEKRRAIERCLYLAIQNIIDIGSHIISALNLGMPGTYEEIIVSLGQHKIIPLDFAESIKKMAGFRNILEHEYVKIDLEKVYENLQRIEDFERFAAHIVQFTEKESHEEIE